jgi:formate dehydrogenase subunit beta
MTKVLKINKGITEGIKEFLRYLLEEKKVRAVFTLRRENPTGAVNYSLISDPKKLEDAVPLYPVMPNNAGKLLSHLTLSAPLTEFIAVVIRPCELRALVELIKRKQGSMANMVIISSVCAGVYPLKKLAQGEEDQLSNDYWSAVSEEEPAPGIRDACRSCEHFVPLGADVIVAAAGESDLDKACSLFIHTEKGAELIEGAPGELEEAELETEKIARIRSLRQKEKENLFKETRQLISGLEGVVGAFSACIGCHGCRAVCPICYCQLCEFDSPRSEYTPENFETELRKRGGVRVPPGTITFQIGRLTHMGISCVGCGMCSDVCPADIPVSSIFADVGESVQKMFEYLPGKDVEEELPITTFEEQELSEVED